MYSYSFLLFSYSCMILNYFQPSFSEIIIEENLYGFSVSIDSKLMIFDHSILNPTFSLVDTSINFKENKGNFIINETNNLGPIPLPEYQIQKLEDENGNAITSIIFTSPDYTEHSLELRLWDWESYNGLNISCSFSVRLSQPSSTFNRINLKLPSSIDEHFYGLGEQFTHFDLKGYNYTIFTREQGVGRNKSDLLTQLVELGEPGAGGDYDFTYWPQASFISSRQYFLSLQNKDYLVVDFENENYAQIKVQSNEIKGHILYDETSLLSLVQNVSSYYGRQPELPQWVYNGAILGVQGGTEKMLEYLSEAQKYNVSVSAMWIQDWSGKITTNFGTRVFWNWKWNSTWYPDLDIVIKELKQESDIRVLAYVNPSLNIEGDLFKEGDSKGVFLREGTNLNATYVQDFGDFFCGTVDFWNSDGVEWYKNMIKENMIRFGFSGWMADFGEYTPLDSATFNSSVQMSEIERHNELPVLWAKLNREAVEEENMLSEVMFWTRSGANGASKYSTMLWGGDQNVGWGDSDGLPSSITAGLSAGMSGMGLYHFDIGGYTTLQLLSLTRSKELLLRSAEYSIFASPVMRTHEGNQPGANHQVYSDEDTWIQFGRLTQIFQMLSNYSKEVVRENSELGIPVMRPLFLHSQNDPQSFNRKYEFFYGRDLLVAPVLKPNTVNRTLYIPFDTSYWIYLWQDPSSGVEEAEPGGVFVTVPTPLGYPPVYFRNESKWATLFRNIRQKFYDGYEKSLKDF